jgi:hypothetical protein
MGFRVVEQARVNVRPEGDVRVATCRNGKTVLLTVVVGEPVMQRAGMRVGTPLLLLRGDGDDDGWLEVRETSATADARVLGRMPGTAAGAARFRVPQEWTVPLVPSTGVPDHEVHVARGSVKLRLPAVLRGDGERDPRPSMREAAGVMRDQAVAMPDNAPAAERHAARQSYRTEARSDMLRRLWPLTGMSAAEIRAQLSLLDGPPIPATKTVLYHWCEALGMPTNRSMLAADFATAPEAASFSEGEARVPEAAATLTPQQAVAPPAQVVRSTNGLASRAALPTEHPDKAEAVQMLEAGQTVRYVAEEFGLPVATIATWSAELRGRQQDGKAA